MPVSLGNTNIAQINLGNTKIKEAYRGSTLVYQDVAEPPPGEETFDDAVIRICGADLVFYFSSNVLNNPLLDLSGNGFTTSERSINRVDYGRFPGNKFPSEVTATTTLASSSGFSVDGTSGIYPNDFTLLVCSMYATARFSASSANGALVTKIGANLPVIANRHQQNVFLRFQAQASGTAAGWVYDVNYGAEDVQVFSAAAFEAGGGGRQSYNGNVSPLSWNGNTGDFGVDEWLIGGNQGLPDHRYPRAGLCTRALSEAEILELSGIYNALGGTLIWRMGYNTIASGNTPLPSQWERRIDGPVTTPALLSTDGSTYVQSTVNSSGGGIPANNAAATYLGRLEAGTYRLDGAAQLFGYSGGQGHFWTGYVLVIGYADGYIQGTEDRRLQVQVDQNGVWTGGDQFVVNNNFQHVVVVFESQSLAFDASGFNFRFSDVEVHRLS